MPLLWQIIWTLALSVLGGVVGCLVTLIITYGWTDVRDTLVRRWGKR
jgi:hypothetical protein